MTYKRLRTHGDNGRFRTATPEEIIEAFDTGFVAIPECGCWIWTRQCTKAGYGIMPCSERFYAHRYSYEKFVGDIPDGLHVLHRCDVPACVNPAHLFLGTQRDNNNDKMAKGRAGGGSMKGEAHPSAKLTPEQVLKIRKLIAAGGNQTRVGEMFGITQSQVWSIHNRRTWRHV